MQQTIAELGATIETAHGRLDEMQQELQKKLVGQILPHKLPVEQDFASIMLNEMTVILQMP